MVDCNADNLFLIEESYSYWWLYIFIEYDNGNTYTMWDKSNVFSGCSGNLGKLFFPFSGTHLKLFRKEWPICLLGDFYKTIKIWYKVYIWIYQYSFIKNFENSVQHVQNYCTLLFHDHYYVFPKLYRAKNSLGKVDMNDISDICIGSRWSSLYDMHHTWQDGPLKDHIWKNSIIIYICNNNN